MQEKYIKLLNDLLPHVVITKGDPAHDFEHTKRVLNMAIKIGENTEGADLEVLIPAALFHDAIVFRKDDPKNKQATELSAEIARSVLAKLQNFPYLKIKLVEVCIRECSFSKGIPASTLESKILQDADRLEATGAIAILRTFSSGGQMERPFYNPEDPFRENSKPNTEYGLDLFPRRLFLVSSSMNTEIAKNIAARRHKFLVSFVDELRTELYETDVWTKPAPPIVREL